MRTIDDMIDALKELPAEKQESFIKTNLKRRAERLWVPNHGPQTDAYFSKADILLYGGEAGPGKTDLVLGLAFEEHTRSLVMRRQYTDMGAMVERAKEINTTDKGYNGAAPMKLRTVNDKLIEFGAAAKLGDEQHWKGQAHDFLGIDEVVDFLELQVRYLMGWVRSTVKGQRTRIVFATNPPITADGQWIIPMFAPWLDIAHPNPAKPGELRWYVTDPDDTDTEVSGPEPVEFNGKPYIPQSRTFIPGKLRDNPFLIDTGYDARLDAMPEPMRSAYRDGNFMIARKDAHNQVIPTQWVIESNKRWRESPPEGIPMCALSADMSGGGDDPLVLARRHDGWFSPMVEEQGKEIPIDRLGKHCSAVIVAHRRDKCPVILDMGGGYGGGTYENLVENEIEAIPWKGTEGSSKRTKDNQFGFFNKRSQSIWQFREALDPDQDGGSPVSLPQDQKLMADLTTPTFEVVTQRGRSVIKVENKEDVVKTLGRSSDSGDAVVICWQAGIKQMHHARPDSFPHSGSRKIVVHTKRSRRDRQMRRRN
jgi:hypothetical protein